MTKTTKEQVATRRATKEEFDVLLDEIIDNFDFEKVHKVMQFLNWKWINHKTNELEIPDIKTLRKAARRYLRMAYDLEATVGSGGFEARYERWQESWGDEDRAGLLSLQFVLVCSDTEGYQL